MDGDAVTAEPSTLTEFFMRMFPYYMTLGMSYDEYWHGPVWLCAAYREAYDMRIKREEWARHRQGAYIYYALLCAAPVMRAFGKGEVKPGKYPDEPWPLTQHEADECERQREIAGYEKALAERKAEIARRKEMEAIKDGDD